MQPPDWDEAAALNLPFDQRLVQVRRQVRNLSGGLATTRLFCEVYEALDPAAA